MEMQDSKVSGASMTIRIHGGPPWGFTVKEIFKDDTPSSDALLMISKVDPLGKSADHLYLEDVLLAINGQHCPTVDDAKNLMQMSADKETLALQVWRRTGEPAKNSSPLSDNVMPCEETPVSPSNNDADTIVKGEIADDLISTNSDTTINNNTPELSPAEEIFSRRHSLIPTTDSNEMEFNYPGKSSSNSGLNQHFFGKRDSLYSSSSTCPSWTTGSQSDLRTTSSSRSSMDHSGYQQCGLPSGTLYRNSSSSSSRSVPQQKSMAQSVASMKALQSTLAGYANGQNRPAVFKPIRPTSLSAHDEYLETMQCSPSLLHPKTPEKLSPTSSTEAKNQKMINLLNSSRVPSGNIYRATPSAQWSQTEASVGTYICDDPPVVPQRQPRRSVPTIPSKDLPSRGPTSRFVPVTPGKNQLQERRGSDFTSPGTPVTPTRTNQTLVDSLSQFDALSTNKLDRQSEVTGHKQSSSRFSDTDEEVRHVVKKMPMIRTLVGDNPNNDQQLTTVKEIRTYHIRPKYGPKDLVNTVDESSNDKPQKAPAQSEEFRHRREASLDSSVSWQSNSTNSSGYSSVALSSSTPTLDGAVSDETLVPCELMEMDHSPKRPSPLNSGEMKRSPTDTSDAEAPQRSFSVSEIIKNFKEARTPPNPPPKPRFAHLPAQKPDVSVNAQWELRARGGSVTSLDSFAPPGAIEDNRDALASLKTRRVSTSAIPPNAVRNNPVHAEEKETVLSEGSDGLVKPSLQSRLLNEKHGTFGQKPIPTYRTAVHGLMLGGRKASVQHSGIAEDPGYGSGDIQISTADSSNDGASTETSESPTVDRQVELEDHSFSEKADKSASFNIHMSTDETELRRTKEALTGRLSERIALLKEEQTHIQRDMSVNDEAGTEIAEFISTALCPDDYEKYKQHLKELEEITALTMSLTGRISRLDLQVNNLRSPADDLEISTLSSKKKKLESQHSDALYLQKGVERRRAWIQERLARCLPADRFREYQSFFTTKVSLLRDFRKLDDNIRLGEEQLRCLQSTSSMS